MQIVGFLMRRLNYHVPYQQLVDKCLCFTTNAISENHDAPYITILLTSKQDMPGIAVVGLPKDHVAVDRVTVGIEGVSPTKDNIPGTQRDSRVHHVAGGIGTLVGRDTCYFWWWT